jgi:hypothetical protein
MQQQHFVRLSFSFKRERKLRLLKKGYSKKVSANVRAKGGL